MRFATVPRKLAGMLYLYLVCAGFAGTFIAFSLVTGGDGAANEIGDGGGLGGGYDLDPGHDHASHAHGAHDAGVFDASFSWLPLTSLRFWMFTSAFFGLTGVAVTWLTGAGTLLTLALSLGVGWLCGVIASWVTYALAMRDATSHVSDLDLEGASGVVIVGFAKGELGKIRIKAKGRAFDVLACTKEDASLGEGTQVRIVSMSKGQAMVAPMAT